MDSASVPVFVNPAAGRGRAGRKLVALGELLTRSGLAHSIQRTSVPGDLERQVFAEARAGAARVIVVGGDGSIHEAVNGILRSGHATALGVIPIGTGNDFAKACRIPLHWEDAASLLCDRILSATPARAIDAGRMNERYFANGAGIGFDARVTSIARSNRLPIGDLVYLIAVMQALWDGVATAQMSIRFDGQASQGPKTLVNISNGPWVGGMFHIAPAAKNDDGNLDLVIADPVSRLRILQLLPRLMGGTHIDEPELSMHPIRECVIEAESPLPSHLDGEVQPLQSRFEFQILPGALSLA